MIVKPTRTWSLSYLTPVFHFPSDAPTVTIHQCSTPVTEGDNATLHCNATGNPAPNVTWIQASTGEIASFREILVIEAVKRNESGSYVCRASNGIGTHNTSCAVNVNCK